MKPVSLNRGLRCVIFTDSSVADRLVQILGKRVVAVVSANTNRVSPDCFSSSTYRGFKLLSHPGRNDSGFPQFVTELEEMSPDVILSFSYSRLISDEILSLAALDAVNVHGGLLPEFRGANILNWCLIEGREETGVTTHELTGIIDGGDIAYRDFVPIFFDDTALTLRDRLTEVGLNHVERAISAWDQGHSLPKTPQILDIARTYPRRKPDDGAVTCNDTDSAIYNMIRALVSPWPGARFTNCQGEKSVIDHFVPYHRILELRTSLCPNCRYETRNV